MRHFIILRLFLGLLTSAAFAGDIIPPQISIGGNHVVALSYDRALWVWGSNSEHQIGQSTTDVVVRPTRILNYTSFFAKVSAGTSYTLALTRDSVLYALGVNDKGQYGAAVTPMSQYFTRVEGSKWRDVFAGNGRSYGIQKDGALWGWGDNGLNLLGIGAASGIQAPVQIGTRKWKSISQGSDYALGIQEDGTLWAWGDNAFGQLGDSTNNFRAEPVQILKEQRFQKVVTGGGFTGAIDEEDRFWMWGRCDANQIPLVFQNTSIPVKVAEGLADVALGNAFGVAVDSAGGLYWWGWFGASLASYMVKLENPPGPDPIKSVYAAGGVVFAVDDSGVIFSMGRNANGEVGNGTRDQADTFGLLASSPLEFHSRLNMTVILQKGQDTIVGVDDYLAVPLGNRTVEASLVALPSKVVAYSQGKDIHIRADRSVSGFDTIRVEAVDLEGRRFSFGIPVWVQGEDPIGLKVSETFGAEYHSAAIAPDSSLWFWGWHLNGSFGTGATENVTIPTRGPEGKWLHLTVGVAYTLGIRADSTLWSWGGMSGTGVLGVQGELQSYEPIQVSEEKWTDVRCDDRSCLAIRADSTLWRWGEWDIVYEVPVQLGEGKWIKVNTGNHRGFAIRKDSTLWAIGAGVNGVLGVGDEENHWELVQVGADKWLAVSTETSWSAGIKADGSLWVWGYYRGCNPERSVLNFVPVALGVEKWRSIDLTRYVAAAIHRDGTLWTFGSSSLGLLGDEEEGCREYPKRISSDPWISVSAGIGHMTAVKADSTAYTWGSNSSGELGNGTTISHMVPQPVPRLNQSPAFKTELNIPDTLQEDFPPIQISWQSIVEDGDGDSLALTALSKGGNIQIADAGKAFRFSSNVENWWGSDTILFFVKDSRGGSAVYEHVLVVERVNDDPVLVSVDDMSFKECSRISVSDIPFEATDIDGNPLRLRVKNCDYCDENSIDLSSYGTKTITLDVVVTDEEVESNQKTLQILCENFNSAPTIRKPKPFFFLEDQTVSVPDSHFETFDADGDSIFIEMFFFGGNIQIDGKKLSAPKDWSGISEINVVATDGLASSERVTMLVGVIPQNDPPSITKYRHQDVPMNALLDPVESLAACDDPEGDSCWLSFLPGENYTIKNGRAYSGKDYVGELGLRIVAYDKKDSSAVVVLPVKVTKPTFRDEDVLGVPQSKEELMDLFDILGRRRFTAP